jgi:hypothetical protein
MDFFIESHGLGYDIQVLPAWIFGRQVNRLQYIECLAKKCVSRCIVSLLPQKSPLPPGEGMPCLTTVFMSGSYQPLNQEVLFMTLQATQSTFMGQQWYRYAHGPANGDTA